MKIAELTNPVLGQPGSALNPQTGTAGIGSFIKIIQSILSLFLVAGAVVFLIIFLIGGIKWITSGGDKEQLASARGTIINSLIGLFLILSVFAIIKLIENFFNVNILSIDTSLIKI